MRWGGVLALRALTLPRPDYIAIPKAENYRGEPVERNASTEGLGMQLAGLGQGARSAAQEPVGKTRRVQRSAATYGEFEGLSPSSFQRHRRARAM